MTIKSMLVKKFKWRVIPPHLKKPLEAFTCFEWQEAMEVEMNSMNINDVWDLKEIPNGTKTVGSKIVYKTKCDSKWNVERYKT